MKNKNYLNQTGEYLYILHFPGVGTIQNKNIIEENLNRDITVSNNLSIISIMNQSCWEDSPVKKQCEHNNIALYNTALNEYDWNNTLKINHILQCLDAVDTEYVLILDGRDVVITRNLDDGFIEKYKMLNKPIIFNGTPLAFPKTPVESIDEILSIEGKQKFLNAGVCIGTKESLKEFYSKAALINAQNPYNQSEQLIIRKTRKAYPYLAGHDSENKIFRIVHDYDTVIKETDDGFILI